MSLINTQAKKAQHPLLSKIPDALWMNEFGYDFNDDEIKHLDKPFNMLKRKNFPKSITQAVILIHYCYPHVQAAQWIPFLQDKSGKFGQKNNESDTVIFIASALCGDIKALDWFRVNRKITIMFLLQQHEAATLRSYNGLLTMRPAF